MIFRVVAQCLNQLRYREVREYDPANFPQYLWLLEM
jgi:hypothetical protein